MIMGMSNVGWESGDFGGLGEVFLLPETALGKAGASLCGVEREELVRRGAARQGHGKVKWGHRWELVKAKRCHR